MALTSALCTTFKKELLEGDHDFNNGADAFKIALFKANASITGTHGAATTNYTDMTGASDELANGSGYTSAGEALTNADPTNSGTTAITDFADVSWTSATFTTRGCLIYNTSDSGSAVMVIDFGGDYTVTGGTFTVSFPAADASNAIIRIA
jgi:hypothetical protein|tara:strand:- start:1441 stop:1893 length:453 start_codon:yes stop_codon:yes gene_type:complete